MERSIDRRGFLKRGALGAAALSSFAVSAQARSPLRSLASKKVIVVGAGLAGLVAAYELTQAGHDVTILEARTRPGGRVYTMREPFSDGLYAEAGAVFVPDDHPLTLKYLKLFDLALDPILPRKLSTLYHVRGKRVKPIPGEQVDWPLDLTAEERRLGLHGMMDKYVAPALKEMTDPASAQWPPDSLKKYDEMTFGDFLRKQGASADAVALLRLGYLDVTGDGIDSYSALSQLRDSALDHADKHFTIRGGSDLLPKALAARLKERVFYGSPVVKIEHSAEGVRAVFAPAGTHQKLTADHLICAVPFSVLRHVEISPPFSAEKRRAIEQLCYTSVTRVFLQTRKRFWIDRGLSGMAHTDLPIMTAADATVNQPGMRGILAANMCGLPARRAAAMGEAQRVSFALAEMEKVHPGVRANFEGGASKCWDEDEWSRGDYCWFKPGQMFSLLPHIARREGRVHFAGEHASAWPGWMQGAIESGIRAAREVEVG